MAEETVSGTQGVLAGMPIPLYAASPSKLLAFLDCPRRYRFQYLDRPAPPKRAQRAHTSLGNAVHNALRDWWDQPDRTPGSGAALVERGWIDVGFRDAAQSAHWRARSAEAVSAYLAGVDAGAQPTGIERTIGFVSEDVRFTGRIDRLDDRDGELVVVDYKTSRRPPTTDDARVSLPLALYAAGVWKMFRRPTFAVELHHVPTGTVVRHDHTPQSLTRHVDRAKAIARDARRADEDFARDGAASASFPPVPGPLCGWCDFRAHCPEGQLAGPERSGWAALEDDPPAAAAEEGSD
jgi:putative RecB family exonuclease